MSVLTWQMIILTAGWIPMLGFAVGYPLLAGPWYRSQFGRSLETSEVSMAVLVGLSLASYWFTFILPQPLATAVIVLITVSAWMRFVAMLTEQFRADPGTDLLQPPVSSCPSCGSRGVTQDGHDGAGQ